MIDQMLVARESIIVDLGNRLKAGDKNVFASQKKDLDRWHLPQTNYVYGAGNMPCPVCKTGILHYQRSAYNGHVHGQCTTTNCVWWRE